MTIASRVLKAELGNETVEQVHFSELSKAACSRLDSVEFAPLSLPTVRSSRFEADSNLELESALTALHSTAGQLQAQRDEWLDQSQHEAVRLGIAIAERLLRRTLAVQPDAIFDVLRCALEWSAEANRLRVRLHPSDAELILSASAAQRFDAGCEIDFIADDSLTRGDCVIETSNGQTDARLNVILQRISDELLA